MSYRNDQGFTLVELLVVVAILAMLAMVAAPRIQTAGAAARQARAEKDLKTIQEALEGHYADHGYYPKKLSELVTRGYIKPALGSERFGQFKSPTSKSWYFYAVDDNRDNKKPQAYVLGNPSPDAPTDADDGANDLRRTGFIPHGRRPDYRAWGWIDAQGNDLLNLYEEDDDTEPWEGDLPRNLATYRASCQSTSTAPCDLWSN